MSEQELTPVNGSVCKMPLNVIVCADTRTSTGDLDHGLVAFLQAKRMR